MRVPSSVLFLFLKMSDSNQTLPAIPFNTAIELYASLLEKEENEFDKPAFLKMVQNQRAKMTSNEEIFDLLCSLYPNHPDPEDYYQHCMTSPNGVLLAAQKASKKTFNQAASLTQQAQSELHNKLLCAEFQNEA